MTDIVIPIGLQRTDSIKWSLRTLWYHFPHDRVILVGQVDSVQGWAKNTEMIQIDQDRRRRAANQRANLEAIATSDLSEGFIWWDDDHFILQDRTTIPPYNCGTITEALTKHKPRPGALPGEYWRAFSDCLTQLQAMGYEDGWITPHIPFPASKTNLIELLDKVEANLPLWLVWKTLYLSIYVPDSPFSIDPRYQALDFTTEWWAATKSTWVVQGKPLRDRYWHPSFYEDQ